MSQPPSVQHEDVELRISLPGGLRVLVTAPSSASGLAAELLGYISLFRSGRSESPTERSFTVVSSAPRKDSEPVLPGAPAGSGYRAPETRDSIQRSFAPCPSQLLRHSSRLCGSTLSGSARVERAWLAGQWAKAVQDRRIGNPNRTPTIDLRPRFYAVLFAEGLDRPTIFKSSASYWRCIGALQNSSSISQSFPSEIEARIYLQAAGADLDGVSEVSVLVAGVRPQGLLVALPVGFIPEAVGNGVSPPGIVGPSTALVVPGRILEGGVLTPIGQDVPVVVVDFSEGALQHIRLPTDLEVPTYSFDPEQPFAILDPETLLGLIQQWVAGGGESSALGF
eukprot:s1376_g16.t1